MTPVDPLAKFEVVSSPFTNASIATNSATLSVLFQDWDLRHLWKLVLKVTDSYGRTDQRSFHLRATASIDINLNPVYNHECPTKEFFGVLVRKIYK